MNLRTFLCCCIAVGLVVGAVRCKADCVLDAQIAQKVSEMKPTDRVRLRENTIRYGSRDSELDQSVMFAIAAAEAGIPPGEMWAKCESY